MIAGLCHHSHLHCYKLPVPVFVQDPYLGSAYWSLGGPRPAAMHGLDQEEEEEAMPVEEETMPAEEEGMPAEEEAMAVEQEAMLAMSEAEQHGKDVGGEHMDLHGLDHPPGD